MEVLRFGMDVLCCRYVLFSLFVITVTARFCPTCCNIGGGYCGDVTPNDLYILTGQQLLLYCHLHNHILQNYAVNSSDVKFLKGNSLLPLSDVRILNESTAVLNITIKDLNDKGTYYCNFNDEKVSLFGKATIGRQVVNVEYYPQKISTDTVHCVVYDWDVNLTCYWKTPDVTYSDKRNIKTQVLWKNHVRFKNCTNIENNQCTLTRSDAKISVGQWHFRFEVTNIKTNVTVTSDYVFMDFDFVKPSKVSSFKTEVISSSCIRLNLKHERMHRSKFYEISYVSKYDSEVKKLNTSRSEDYNTTEQICNLIPYTVYNFTVGVYPDEITGYRSDLVETSARTKQDIPALPPKISEGSYIGNLDHCVPGNMHRNVTLYWKAIQERYLNGELTEYMIEYLEDGKRKTKHVKPDKTWDKIQVQCDKSYVMKIKAKTTDFSKDAATINILDVAKKDIKPPKEVIPVLEVITNVTQNMKALVNVSWTPADSVVNVKGYTVYWCPYTNKYICDREINWGYVNGSDSSFIITFENYKEKYLFGVSMETDIGSSGFVWDSCLYIKDADPRPPKVVLGQSPPNRGLTVTWSADYCNGDSPYIIGYKVRYCVTDAGEKNCKDHVRESALIQSSSIKRYDIGDLDDSKTYGIVVRSVSKNRESPDSEMIIGQPHDSNLKPGPIAGIAIAGVFVVCLAAAGLVFCYRICKKKTDDIRKPYEITVPVIKTNQMNGNGNLIGYTNLSEPSTPVESNQLLVLNGFMNGVGNGKIQKQISRDSGHESITSETPNSPGPDPVANKSNEFLLPVKEESDVSSNSNVLSSKATEESSLSERLHPNKNYSQIALLISESEDSSLLPSSDNMTDEGRQNPVFLNSGLQHEKIFTVAHVTSIKLDNDNPFCPNSKKVSSLDRPENKEIENSPVDCSGNTSVSQYVKADLCSGNDTSVTSYMRADLIEGSENPQVLLAEKKNVEEQTSGDVSDYQKANYGEFIYPIEYESDKDSVSDYITNAGIPTSLSVRGMEGYIPVSTDDQSAQYSAGDLAQLESPSVDLTPVSAEGQDKDGEAINELPEDEYVVEVPKMADTDSINTTTSSEHKISEDESLQSSTTSCTSLLNSHPASKTAASDSVTNGYISNQDLDSNILKEKSGDQDSTENLDSANSDLISCHDSLTSLENRGYVTDPSETAYLENENTCSVTSSPEHSQLLLPPANSFTSAYVPHDLVSKSPLPSDDHKLKDSGMNGYISEDHLQDIQGSGDVRNDISKVLSSTNSVNGYVSAIS